MAEFVPNTRSPLQGVAIFSVYSDDLIAQATPSSGAPFKYAHFLPQGAGLSSIHVFTTIIHFIIHIT